MDSDKLFLEALAEIEKQFGKGSIQQLNNKAKTIDSIPSGSLHLDRALGVNGYPKGRIIEIYGAESSGKTTLALQAIAQCQKMNGKCAYIDAENALDAKFCEINGVDLNQLLLSQPDSGEQAFAIIEALIKTNMIDLIVVDSVAALTPQSELEGNFDDQTIGLHARMMSKGLRILQGLISKYKTTIIFINQIREKVGVVFGSNITTPGGRALKFYSSVRIELKRNELIKNGNDCVGIRSIAKIVKNKVAPPLMNAFIDIYFDKGFDYTGEIIDFALEKSIINKKGTWYFWNDQKLAQGKEATKTYLLNNKTIYEEIKNKTLNSN